MTIKSSEFGKIEDVPIKLFTISNENISFSVSELGAAIVEVKLREVNNSLVLGYDTPQEYATSGGCLGAVCGRHANRIEGATIDISNVTYKLEKNNGENNIHSGPNGYHRRVFTGKQEGQGVEFSLLSFEGDQGYPGNLSLRVNYSLTDRNGILIEYTALADKTTVCNLTNHTYFNLDGKSDILDTMLKLDADFYTPINSGLVPNGEILTVENTPFDFREFKRIGERIDAPHEQLKFAGGYDHNLVLKRSWERPFAEAYSKQSGVHLRAYTDMPGVQFYTGNFLTARKGRGGVNYDKHSGFCLETQNFPNSAKYPHFTSPIIRAGEVLYSKTEYIFSR